MPLAGFQRAEAQFQAGDPLLDRLMPGYRHEDELAALTSPSARAAARASGAVLGGYSDFVADPELAVSSDGRPA